MIVSFADKQTEALWRGNHRLPLTHRHEPRTKAILASTPGRILKTEFLEGFHLTQMELSKRTGIPRSTINEIIKGKRAISAETAFALGSSSTWTLNSGSTSKAATT